MDAEIRRIRQEKKTSAGPVDKGTTYYDKGRMGTFRGEASDFERPTKVEFRETLRWLGMKVMEARPTYTLEVRRRRNKGPSCVRRPTVWRFQGHAADSRRYGTYGKKENGQCTQGILRVSGRKN